MTEQMRPGVLVLEDGTVYRGTIFAGHGEAVGEVVFNTGMTGYQEILTDPSYTGQLVAMTCPLIGVCGANDEDMESATIHTGGLIVREYQARPSNWRATMTLADFLERHGRLGLTGIDTRALTRHIRSKGALRGIMADHGDDIPALLEKVRAWPGLEGRDLVREVSCASPWRWRDGGPAELGDPENRTGGPRVLVVDCGAKYTIMRRLEERGCEVIVVPASTTAKALLGYRPDGVLLSNGPGDPAPLSYLVKTVKGLLGKVPVFGICLGHQILCQALGAKTEKLKFGHHGCNQPASRAATHRVEISSQNHGFSVIPASLPPAAAVSHTNLNDGTLEGISCPEMKAFSVQYHPEAAPGPQDAAYLFDDFAALLQAGRGE